MNALAASNLATLRQLQRRLVELHAKASDTTLDARKRQNALDRMSAVIEMIPAVINGAETLMQTELDIATKPPASAHRLPVPEVPGAFTRTMQDGDVLREAGSQRHYKILSVQDGGRTALAKNQKTGVMTRVDASWDLRDTETGLRVYLPAVAEAANDERSAAQ